MTDELLTPGDIEGAARRYLLDRMRPTHPSIVVEVGRPDELDWRGLIPPAVRLQAVDGSPPRAVVLDDAILSVEVWHSDSHMAATVAGQICAQLNAWRGLWADVVVYTAECARPRVLPDPLTAHARYLMTVNVTARLVGSY